MKFQPLVTCVISLALAVTAIWMAMAVKMPSIVMGGMALVFLAAALAPVWKEHEPWPWLLLWWSGLALIGVRLVAGDRQWFVFESYYLVIVWMILAALLLVGAVLNPSRSRTRWRAATIAAGVLIHVGWLTAAYRLDAYFDFHAALVGTVVLLACFRWFFPLPAPVIHAVHTLMLLLVALPVADAMVRPSREVATSPEQVRRHYSYEASGGDPKSFARWWSAFLPQCYAMMWEIGVPDRNGQVPLILVPGSRGTLFDSRIRINRLGFRGPEIEADKRDAYRIVALGESTTFGMTLSESDQPWPRLLEELIEERLNPDRPVQVINAGIPSYTLRSNLQRVESEILRLQPDLIVSYHGYNGFPWLDACLPPVADKAMPAYHQRPLKILADCEYRLRMMRYNRDGRAAAPSEAQDFASPLQNEYAGAYRDLIRLARTNGIRLVLTTYSMSVNSQSDPKVIEFYRAGFPKVHSQIRANALHSLIVQRLSGQHPEVVWVDTRPALDGQHEKFIDLVHFTQEGRRALAQTLFAEIREILEHDLSRPRSSAVTHSGP